MRRRHLLFGAPLLAAMLLFLVVLIDLPFKLRIWFATAYVVLFVVAAAGWGRFLRHRYSQFPEVRCPTCGGLARVEMPDSAHAHYYLACSRCGQRADTDFGSVWSPYASET